MALPQTNQLRGVDYPHDLWLDIHMSSRTTTKNHTVKFDAETRSHTMSRKDAIAYLADCRSYLTSQGQACSYWVARLDDDGEWVSI